MEESRNRGKKLINFNRSAMSVGGSKEVPQREVVWRFDVVEREEEIWPWEFWKRWR
jgi:hypothetical protein